MAVPVYQAFAEAKSLTAVTEISINKPAGVVEGDLMVVCIAKRFTATVSCSGWTTIQEGTNAAIHIATMYKIAGDSEPASYTFSWVLPGQIYSFIMRITGHDSSTPINISGLGSGTSASPTCPTVTTTLNDCLMLRLLQQMMMI